MQQTIKKTATRCLAFVLTVIALLGLIPTNAFAAEALNGGFGMSPYESLPVYQMMNLTQKIGTIYAGEGFTVLVEEANSYYVEYSTSSGAKRGYVSKNILYNNTTAGVGRMTSSANVYFGKGTSYGKVGSVSTGEYVVILAKDSNWTYIEYNYSGGRKRGYCPTSAVNSFDSSQSRNYPSVIGTSYGGIATIINDMRYGPSTQYPIIDSLNPGTVYNISKIYIDFEVWYFAQYTTSNGTVKTGYYYGGTEI